MKKLLTTLVCLVILCSSVASAEFGNATQYPPSMYKVGSDIPAGTYMAISRDNAIIPTVTVKDGSGSDATILLLSIPAPFSIVGLRDGEYVDVSDCYLVDIESTQAYVSAAIADGIADGMYLVGYHIDAGEYKYTAKEGATLPMITVYDDPYQDRINNLIIPEGTGYISLADGEYVSLSEVSLQK